MDTPVLVFAALGILLGFAQLLRRGGEVEVAQREQFTKMVKDLYIESREWRSMVADANRQSFQLVLLRERAILAHELLVEVLQECDHVKLPKALLDFISEAAIDALLARSFPSDAIAAPIDNRAKPNPKGAKNNSDAAPAQQSDPSIDTSPASESNGLVKTDS